MLFSDHFNLIRTAEDDWFDPILNEDTSLFVDPFLIFKEEEGFWSDAHSILIRHFDTVFRLVAEGNHNPKSLAYRKALALLEFLEPKELGLGYTSRGTAGAGSGRGFATVIAEAVSDAIRRGIEHPSHFEELGILNEGIGSDRISDILTVAK